MTDFMNDQSTLGGAANDSAPVVPRLALAGIGKQYPSVRANDDVHLVMRAESSDLVGEASEESRWKRVAFRVIESDGRDTLGGGDDHRAGLGLRGDGVSARVGVGHGCDDGLRGDGAI